MKEKNLSNFLKKCLKKQIRKKQKLLFIYKKYYNVFEIEEKEMKLFFYLLFLFY